MSYSAVYVNPTGRTDRGLFVGALLTLLAAVAFYYFIVKNRTGDYCLVVLLFPAAVLHARRLRDMGQSAWLVLAPVALFLATAWFHILHHDAQLETPVTLAAVAV